MNKKKSLSGVAKAILLHEWSKLSAAQEEHDNRREHVTEGRV